MDRPGEADGERTSMRQFEQVVVAAKALEPTDPAGAAACMGQLAQLVATIHARRGNSWYLIGNPDKAREDHALALALNPKDVEALFFSGAMALETAHGDKAKMAEGKAYWERLLKVAPDHPRAALVRETIPRIEELFGAKPGMEGRPAMADQGSGASAPMLPPGMADSMQQVKHTPEMDAQLDKTTEAGEELLKKGEWQQALDTFKQVMPLRPSGRIALDMGIALRELGKPTAERVLMNATQMPGGDNERAKFELAILYEKTNPAQARELLQGLTGDPKLGADARARLAKLQ
jgi:tetratricopeptide (TPR) repeat protein